MQSSRRQLLRAGACALATPLLTAGPARAEAYPSKPIRLVVPFTAGAANDTIARLIGQKIGDSLGQTVLVENRAGAGGGVGASLVAKSKADGYTLLLVNPGPAVITPLVTGQKLYSVTDFSPIVPICGAPMILVAASGFGPNNPAELLKYARANPGKVKFGSADAGGITGLALTLFLAATKMDVLAVPFKGSAESMTAAASGTIDVVYASYASAQGLLSAKKVKIIGIAGPKRISAIPNVPTLSESGIRNADLVAWYGLAAPAGTPRLIIAQINHAVNRALELPEVQQKLALLELEPMGGSTEAFENVVTKEAARVNALIKAGRLTVSS